MSRDGNDGGSHGANKSMPFRSWYYFRTGYAEYYIFLIGLANTLTVTFYLAVDNYPELQSMFPTFTSYVATVLIIGFPLMVFLGYLHIRRSSAYRSQLEIDVEANPYVYKLPPGTHKEALAPFLYETLGLLKRMDAGEELNPDEILKIKNLIKTFGFLSDGGILKRPSNFEGI